MDREIRESERRIGIDIRIIDLEQRTDALGMRLMAVSDQDMSDVVVIALYQIKQLDIHMTRIYEDRITMIVADEIGVRKADD